ncbi:MAG: LLM class flavin-dependent oxidoreductase [Actinomycetota bacterium]|nr:LLM class flavin-dependent oxidoreductase [Actinomycetota bacterium]
MGIVLPTFEPSAAPAFAAADEAERAGLHGVFAYDHLWPMGQPGRPAISPYPLLGAVSARTSRVALGTLVARVGLVPDEVLVAELVTLHALSSGRAVVAIGAGDAKSAAENLAYGVAFEPPATRRERVRSVVTRLSLDGVPAWVGGGAPETDAIAREVGAALNLWGAAPEAVARAALDGEVTWAGMLPEDVGAAAALLSGLARAGASWAVAGWAGSSEPVVAAASAAGLALG